MAQLKERDTDETIDNQLLPEEVEGLRELGVEVEEQEREDDEGSSGSGSGDAGDEEEEEEEQGSGPGGDQEQDEEIEPDEGSSGDGEQSDEEADEEGEDGEADGEGSSGEDQDGQDGDDDFSPDNSGLDMDDVEELEEESDIVGEDDVSDDEVDAHVDAINLAGGGERSIRTDCFESFKWNEDWERTGRQYARQLGGMLVDHFENERRTDIKSKQRGGRFDSSEMIRADMGFADVFEREDKPDEKKYHAVIAMDDSGSMDDDGLEEAAVTTGMLVRALEEVGIETTVYRFARSVRLVKLASQSYDEAKDGIFEQTTNGGTMLLPAVEQAEEIAKEHADETFLVVVTDGRPRNEDDVSEALQESSLTSITVQIGIDHETFRGDYDAWVYVDDVGDVPSKTQSAFRRVVM